MRSLLVVVYLMIAATSHAETYKWEDSTGVHYSDNLASVPKQYRVEQQESVKEAANPASLVNIPKQFNTIPYQSTMAQGAQAAADQARAAMASMTFHQAASYAQAQKNAAIAQQKAAEQLSSYLVIMCIIGGLFLLDWIWALIHILKNEFANPTNKVVWLLLVLMLPVLGVILYRIIGRAQTVSYISGDNIERAQLLARLRPNPNKSGNFDIR